MTSAVSFKEYIRLVICTYGALMSSSTRNNPRTKTAPTVIVIASRKLRESRTNVSTLRERNRARTRRDIERAALELFERQGYDATTVDQITSVAGVSSATFFRYFGSKEELLFTDEESTVAELIQHIATRDNHSHTIAALAQPVATYARDVLDDPDATTQRMTRLVMTTRALEARSMRIRLRWEHALSRQLADERGQPETVDVNDLVLASVSISCLATALWNWQRPDSHGSMFEMVIDAFERCARLQS